jgi:hypothetical protein
MRFTFHAGLWGLACLLLLLYVPGVAAQADGPCEIVHVEDETGDPATTAANVDDGDIDIDFACVASETTTDLVLVIQTVDDIEETATQDLEFRFNFKADAQALVAQVNVNMGGTAVSGQADSATIEGNVMTIVVKKADLGFSDTMIGTPITGLFVESEAQLAGLVDPDQARATDRAPDEGFGLDYTWGQLADPSQDTDGDGVPDRDEIAQGSDPRDPDQDGDGLLDGPNKTLDTDNETAQFFQARGIFVVEQTGSTTTFGGEADFGTNATLADTDGDGLLDGGTVTVEPGSTRAAKLANNTPTKQAGGALVYAGELDFDGDPLVADSDGDGIPDGEEISGVRNTGYQNNSAFDQWPGSTDPANADTDDDGLTDLEEVSGSAGERTFLPSDPNNADSDGDGLPDGEEVNDHGTDPTNADSDGDGVDDRVEIDSGSDPTDASSTPVLVEAGDPAQTDWVYALLSTALLLAVLFLAIFGILVRWG